MFKNFNDLLQDVKKVKSKTVVIAAAQSNSALEAAIMTKEHDIANCLLVGDKKYISEYLQSKDSDYLNQFEIIDCGDDLSKAAIKAVQAVKEGRAQILSKGKCDTATLIKAVLDKDNGLRTGEILSDVLVYEHPKRLILMSDGGINLYPTLEEKVSIVKNAVKVALGLKSDCPKVALLSAVETVNPKMPCTLDAAIITQMNRRKQITDCLIDGPLAFDNAIDLNAAKMKGIESPVAGDADVLIVPNIETGNVFGKSLSYYCNYRVAHVVMGAKAPILIASRADNAETKMLSMALGVFSA